jgi:thioesterase III
MPTESDFVVHIFPSDCDSVGHVNHAQMLRLLERARWAALEKVMTYEEYEKSKLWAVVRKVEALYNAQTFPGDDLTIRTGLLSVGNTSFVVRQQAIGRNGAIACDATIVYVTVSAEGKPIPVPNEWKTLFSPWVEDAK